MIKVNDTWYIDVDSNGNYSPGKFSKIKIQKEKDGSEKEVRPSEGYCSSLESALKFIRDRMIDDALSMDRLYLSAAIAKIRTINREFEDKFREAVSD